MAWLVTSVEVSSKTLARTRHVREETVFDGIVLRTMRRVVSHTDFQADAVGKAFQVILEHVPIGSVAAAAVAQQEHASCVGISGPAMDFPPEAETVAGEPTGVVAESQIRVARIALDVVEAVRIDHAERGAGEIVVQSFLGLLRVEPALPEQKPQGFLVLGIHAHEGVGSLQKSGAVVGDDLKLPSAMNVASQRQRCASLATPQAMAFQELRHNGDTDAEASPQEFLGNLGTRKVGPKDAVSVGVARRVGIDDLQEGLVDPRKKRQTALPATPFFRAR
jgi:hypothetical protein